MSPQDGWVVLKHGHADFKAYEAEEGEDALQEDEEALIVQEGLTEDEACNLAETLAWMEGR